MHLRLLHWGLRHRRWRHALNTLVIASTVAVVVVFVSAMSEIVAFSKKGDSNELVRLLIAPRLVYGEWYPPTVGATFEKIPGVKIVEQVVGTDLTIDNEMLYVEGVGAAWATARDPMFPVEPAVRKAWEADKAGALVSGVLANKRGIRIGQRLDLQTSGGLLQLNVTGISEGARHEVLHVHYEYLRSLVKDAPEGFRVYATRDDYKKVAKEIAERTRNTPHPLYAMSDAQLQNTMVKEVQMITIVFGFLGCILLCTTIMTLANHAAITIRERRIEIATLRVIGYSRRSIFALVIGEVLVIGLAGSAIAIVALKLVFPSGLTLSTANPLLENFKIGTFAFLYGTLAGVLVPLLGALPAALSSIRKPLAQALRDAA